jgi:hypothetical protein
MKKIGAAVGLALLLSLAACGGDEPEVQSAPAPDPYDVFLVKLDAAHLDPTITRAESGEVSAGTCDNSAVGMDALVRALYMLDDRVDLMVEYSVLIDVYCPEASADYAAAVKEHTGLDL